MPAAEYADLFDIDSDANGDPILVDPTTGDTMFTWDRSEAAFIPATIGTAADPVPGTSHFVDTEHESVSTEVTNTTSVHVGGGGFDSLQAAHDALPADGGTVYLHGGVPETGVVFDKPIRLVGGGAEYPSGNTPPVETYLDTEGGDGLWCQVPCHFDGVTVKGSGGDYNVRLGDYGVYTPGFKGTLSVLGAGGDGLQTRGEWLGSMLDIVVEDATERGWFMDLTGADDYFNANAIRLRVHGCGGVSWRATGQSEFSGNQFIGLNLENGDDRPVHWDNGGIQGNLFAGYGTERHAQPWLIDISDMVPPYENHMWLNTVENSDNQIPESIFNTLDITDDANYGGRSLPLLSTDDGTPVYVYDDFGDGRLTDRLGSRIGRFHRPTVGEEGNWVGTVRPEWVVESGSPSVTGGNLRLPAGDATNQSVQAYRLGVPYGRFEFTFQFQSTPSSGSLQLRFLGATDYYMQQVYGGGGLNVNKNTDANGFENVISDGSWPVDTNEHTVAAERDAGDEWTLHLDGSQTGSAAVDSFTPDLYTPQLWLRNLTDAAVDIKTIQFY